MGSIRSPGVVNIAVACWMPNMIQRTPEQQNNPIMFPLFQEYTEPPNDTAMMPEQRAPENMMDPRKSIRRARVQNDGGGAEGLGEGSMITNTGKVIPTRIRLK